MKKLIIHFNFFSQRNLSNDISVTLYLQYFTSRHIFNLLVYFIRSWWEEEISTMV